MYGLLLKYKNKQRKTSIGFLSNGGFCNSLLLYVNTENRLNNSQLKFGRRIEDVRIQGKPQVLFYQLQYDRSLHIAKWYLRLLRIQCLLQCWTIVCVIFLRGVFQFHQLFQTRMQYGQSLLLLLLQPFLHTCLSIHSSLRPQRLLGLP